MALSGYKQATVAYKVSRPGGQPLDVNGVLCSVSGRKQAIAILLGYNNPDPLRYEIDRYFVTKDILYGMPTISYNVLSCPIGFIKLNPNRLLLTPEATNGQVILESTADWKIIDTPPSNIASIDYAEGSAGQYTITVERTELLGQGAYIFQNKITKQKVALWVVNVTSEVWILDDGTWNTLGFWFDNELWNYKQ